MQNPIVPAIQGRSKFPVHTQMSVDSRISQVSAAEIARMTRARRVGSDRYLGHCPNVAAHKHGDRNASLSIRQLSDRVLLRCFACNDTPAILRFLNITYAHISPPLPNRPLRFHDSRPRPLPVVRDSEEERRERLKVDYRVLATNVRTLHRLIDAEPVLWGDAIPLLAEEERELDAIHAALCGPKPFIYDATRKRQ